MPLCPACLAADPVDVGVASVCARCGANLAIEGRYRLDEVVGGDRSHDVVDGVGPLLLGTDLVERSRVLVRLAADAGDAHRARLEREATISAGLAHPQVPALRARTSTSTIWSAPAGRSVDTALAAGLRVDAVSLRRFLLSALRVFADLEAKSPPVHVRGLHAGNLIVDDRLDVTLIDFARATDTLNDGGQDGTARAGMAPPSSARLDPSAADLYALGVVAVQLAARTGPADLPRRRDGRPDVERATALTPALRSFIGALLEGSFASKRAALIALEALDQQPRRGGGAAALLAGAGAVVIIASGLLSRAAVVDAPELPPRHPPPIVEPPPRYVPPPRSEPPPRNIEQPRRDPPRAEPPSTSTPPPSFDDALLRAIERAVVAQREEIEACPDDGSDRIKLHLTLVKARGAVRALARADSDSVRCVVDALSVAGWPQTPHQQVDADIWVWRRPSFKVAAY